MLKLIQIEARHKKILEMVSGVNGYDLYILNSPTKTQIKAYRELRSRGDMLHEGSWSCGGRAIYSITFRLIQNSKNLGRVKKIIG